MRNWSTAACACRDWWDRRAAASWCVRAPLLVWGGFPGEWEGEHPVTVVRHERFDGVFFTGMDPRTVVLARRAPVLVVTARRFESLAASGVRADALVGSARDRGEQYDISRLAQPPEHVIKTDGMRGGTGYQPVAPPGPVVDAYGAGDTFVAGVLYGLAGGRPVAEAAALGARWAAETVTWRGAYP